MPEKRIAKPLVWLNNRKPPFMESEEKGVLTSEHIEYAVKQMSYTGLQLCAAGYLLCMSKLNLSPKEICRYMEEA